MAQWCKAIEILMGLVLIFLRAGLYYCDIECFALEMNRDHSVILEIASKYCISYSFVDHDGYSISSKGFLPAGI